jgi:hypothetical protein
MWERFRRVSVLSLVFGLSVVCAAPRSARADGDETSDTQTRIHERIDVGTLVVGSAYGVGVGLDASALLRSGVFAIGPALTFEVRPTSGGYSRLGGALRGGFVFPLGESVDLDVLGDFGFADYENVGGGTGLFTPRASGTLPYAGARAGLSFTLVRRGHTRVTLGAWAIYTNDLGRASEQVYTSCGLFNCAGQHAVTIGTVRFGAALGVVVNLD